MQYEKRYTKPGKLFYDLYYIYADGRKQKIDRANRAYFRWKKAGGIESEVEYIAPPERPVITPIDTEQIIIRTMPYDKAIAKIVADRMDKAGYSTEICQGVMANYVALSQIPSAVMTEAQLAKIQEAEQLEIFRQSVITQVYNKFPKITE